MDEARPPRTLRAIGIAALGLAAVLALLIVVLVPADRSYERSLLSAGPFLAALVGIVLVLAGTIPGRRRDFVLGVLTAVFAVLAPILFHTGLVIGVAYPGPTGAPVADPWAWWMLPLGAVFGPLSVALIVIGVLRRWPRVPLVVAICAVIVGTIPVLLVLFSGAFLA